MIFRAGAPIALLSMGWISFARTRLSLSGLSFLDEAFVCLFRLPEASWSLATVLGIQLELPSCLSSFRFVSSQARMSSLLSSFLDLLNKRVRLQLDKDKVGAFTPPSPFFFPLLHRVGQAQLLSFIAVSRSILSELLDSNNFIAAPLLVLACRLSSQGGRPFLLSLKKMLLTWLKTSKAMTYSMSCSKSCLVLWVCLPSPSIVHNIKKKEECLLQACHRGISFCSSTRVTHKRLTLATLL